MAPYQQGSLIQTILALIFYIIMAGFAFYSILAIYTLLRYARSKPLALAVVLLYLVISSGLYAAALINLNSIKFQ